MFDLGAAAPDYWTGSCETEPNGALRTEGSFLSEDFCVIDGENFFIRCVFPIAVHGLNERFAFGIWSTLSRTNFDIYVDRFDEDVRDELGPWTGYFSNRIVGFEETVPEPCWVQPRAERQRPSITLMNEQHDLARAQHEGVTPERVLAIYSAYGHG